MASAQELQEQVTKLERENAELVGVVRMFLWIDKEARTGNELVPPEDAYEGAVLREYRRAITLARRWAR